MKAKWLYLAVIVSVAVGLSGAAQFQQTNNILQNLSNSGRACLNVHDCTPNIAAKEGNVYMVWEEQNETDSSSVVKLTRSTDQGDTFSEPQTIAPASGFNAQDVMIDILPNDDLILVWADDRNNNFDVFVTLSNDNGTTWAWDANNELMNLSNNEGDSLSPDFVVGNSSDVSISSETVGLTLQETFAVVWSDDTGDNELNFDGARNIFLRAGRVADRTLSDTFNVSQQSQFVSSTRFPAEEPAISASPGRLLGTLSIVWQQLGSNAREVFFHQSTGFQPVNISDTRTIDSLLPDIAVRNPPTPETELEDLIATLVWLERVGGDTQVMLNVASNVSSFLSNPGFNARPLNLSQASGSAFAPVVIVGQEDQFIIAWHEQTQVRNRHEVRVVTFGNSLGFPQTVSAESEDINATNVALAADLNNVYIVWVEEDLANSTQDIMFTRRALGN